MNNIMFMLPVSVGHHTNYGGGATTHATTHATTGRTTTHATTGVANTTGSGGSTSGGWDGCLVIGIILVVIIALCVISGRNKRSKGSSTNITPAPVINSRDGEISNIIRLKDPQFSKEKFLSWSEQVFVQLQQAWTERDWKKARPFESAEIFNLHKSQLDEFIRNGTINIMECVCVNESFLCDYAAEENYEFLTVFMDTRYNDYIIKEDTKQVVKGDPNTTYNVQYKLKFMRTIGVLTSELSNKSTFKCPNCGAPVDVNETGKCAYCGTVITNGEHDWVLCNMDDVGQNNSSSN